MYNSLTKATHEQKLQSSLLPEENKSKILFRDTLSYYINLTKKKRIKIFNIAKKKEKIWNDRYCTPLPRILKCDANIHLDT